MFLLSVWMPVKQLPHLMVALPVWSSTFYHVIFTSGASTRTGRSGLLSTSSDNYIMAECMSMPIQTTAVLMKAALRTSSSGFTLARVFARRIHGTSRALGPTC